MLRRERDTGHCTSPENEHDESAHQAGSVDNVGDAKADPPGQG